MKCIKKDVSNIVKTSNFENPYRDFIIPEYTDWRIKPVDVITFFNEYLEHKTLSDAQKRVLLGVFNDDPYKKFFSVAEVLLLVGQGGGKNFLVTGIVVYAIYLHCCLANPHKFFGKFNYEPFHIVIFSPTSAEHTKRVFFDSLKRLIINTRIPILKENWFEKYNNVIIDKPGRKKRKIVHLGEKQIIIPNWRVDEGYGAISIFPMSTIPSSVDGYTTWISIMDEASNAPTKKSNDEAKKQYDTTRINLLTRFKKHNRLFLGFSYPNGSKYDFFIQLCREYTKYLRENTIEINEDVMVAYFSTWVFNSPNNHEQRDNYLKAYEDDPVRADRRFRALVPQNMFSLFLPQFSKVVDCINLKLLNRITIKSENLKQIRKDGVNSEKTKCIEIDIEKISGDNKERSWACFLSPQNAKLVIVGGYGAQIDREIEDFAYSVSGKYTRNIQRFIPITCQPIIDTIMVWEAPYPNVVIDKKSVEKLLLDLCEKHFPKTKAIYFIKWSTKSFRQKLQNRGVEQCERVSSSKQRRLMYALLIRHLFWHNSIEYLDCIALLREMDQLVMKRPNSLQYQNKISPDIWNTFSLCISLIQGSKNLKAHQNNGSYGFSSIEAQQLRNLDIFFRAFKEFLESNPKSPQTEEEIRGWMIDHRYKKFTIDEIKLLNAQLVGWLKNIDGKIKSEVRKIGRPLSPMSSAPFVKEKINEIEGPVTMEKDIAMMERGVYTLL